MKYIKLTQGFKTAVDDELFNWLNQWKWYYKKGGTAGTGYAARTLNGRSGHKNETLRMQNQIMPPNPGCEIDHEDNDGLNNQQYNLRQATKPQNGWNRKIQKNNTSGMKGIYWHKRDQAWRVQLRVDGKKKFIGDYLTEEEAKARYRAAVTKYHGKFANPDEL